MRIKLGKRGEKLPHSLISYWEVVGVKFVLNEAVCSGCRVCGLICALTNFQENNPKKGLLKIHGHFPAPGRYSIKVCTQCGVCASVCPEEAIKENDGIFVIDPELCVKCGLCVEECPEQVMVLHDDHEYPLKCNNCGECIVYCPRGALSDGEEEFKNACRL